MTLALEYKILTFKGFLKPLDLTPMPNLVPLTWNLNENCHFHQKSVHKSDNCFHLKHKIQDLIDNGTLPNPNIITKSNVRKNPHPIITELLPYIRVVSSLKGSIGIVLS